jgi:hypothetical protein
VKKKAPLTLEQATIKAAPYVRYKEKLLWLLEKATRKSQRCYEFLLAPWESWQIFLRLLRAHLAGKFCAPADSILIVVAAVIYFVSPFDLGKSKSRRSGWASNFRRACLGYVGYESWKNEKAA